jgi:hypothetical protein
METDTFRLMSSIAQYAESLFLRFDKDRNDIIGREELSVALKHIAPPVRTLIYDSLDNDPGLRDLIYNWFPQFEVSLLTYMLEKKSIPGILTAVTTIEASLPFLELAAFKEWNDRMPDWIKGEVNITRNDILFVVSSLAYYNRVSRLKKLRVLFWDNDFLFEDGIKDPNAQIFNDIIFELGCSSNLEPVLRKWLFENQKDYWIKEKADTVLNLFGNTLLNGSDIPGNQWVPNWADAVYYEMLRLLYDEKTISPYCNLPYLYSIQPFGRQNLERRCAESYTTGFGMYFKTVCTKYEYDTYD